MQSQRGIGLFGAFIVREKDPISYSVSLIDDPAHHTLTIMDWFREDPEQFCKRAKYGLGDYPEVPIFTLYQKMKTILFFH